MTEKKPLDYHVTREFVYGQIATIGVFALICFGTYHLDSCSKRAKQQQEARPAQQNVPESQLEKDVRGYEFPPVK